VGLSTHEYLYKLLTLCELFISSQYGTGVLQFLCPLMYSLIEEETIQRKKKISSHIPFLNDSHKSVMISNMAISNEKLNGRKPSLSLLGHLGILTNTYDAVNSNKNTRTFIKPTRTAARGSFQRQHLEDNRKRLPFW
jgi:hypothetical protein